MYTEQITWYVVSFPGIVARMLYGQALGGLYIQLQKKIKIVLVLI